MDETNTIAFVYTKKKQTLEKQSLRKKHSAWINDPPTVEKVNNSWWRDGEDEGKKNKH